MTGIGAVKAGLGIGEGGGGGKSVADEPRKPLPWRRGECHHGMAAKYQLSLLISLSIWSAERGAAMLDNPSSIFRNRSFVPRGVPALPQCSSLHLLMCRMSHPQVQDVQTYAPPMTPHPTLGGPSECRASRHGVIVAASECTPTLPRLSCYRMLQAAVGGSSDKIQSRCHGSGRSSCRGETKHSRCSGERDEPRGDL